MKDETATRIIRKMGSGKLTQKECADIHLGLMGLTRAQLKILEKLIQKNLI